MLRGKIQIDFDIAQVPGRVVQRVRRALCVSSSGHAVAGVGECPISMVQVSGGDLLEHLAQRTDSGHHVADHIIRLRWVVERAHSWMNRFRRLLVRWDKKPQNYLAFLHFACGLIAFRAGGLFG